MKTVITIPVRLRDFKKQDLIVEVERRKKYALTRADEYSVCRKPFNMLNSLQQNQKRFHPPYKPTQLHYIRAFAQTLEKK